MLKLYSLLYSPNLSLPIKDHSVHIPHETISVHLIVSVVERSSHCILKVKNGAKIALYRYRKNS